MFFRASYRPREPDLRDWFPERELDFELRPVPPDLVGLRLREDDDERAPAFGGGPEERALAGREP
jgi:hypothetical protein